MTTCTTNAAAPATPFKQQLIEDAYGELGITVYVFDIDPEELEAGLRKLNAMWAMWEDKGLRFGFNAGGALGDESGLPAKAIEATVANLAIRIAPSKGKTPSQDTRDRAVAGLATLTAAAAMPQEQQPNDYLPRGAGNKPWRNPYGTFMPAVTTDPLPVDAGDSLDL